MAPQSLISELEYKGWATIPGIRDEQSLMALAHELGTPLPNPTGQKISQLRIQARAAARPNTLSAKFGTGAFPLHTDTAFWLVPARFLVMRVIGDNRRSTLVCPFHGLTNLAGENFPAVVRESIWTVRLSGTLVYTPMTLRPRGIRYDTGCMNPANRAAEKFERAMSEIAPLVDAKKIHWSEGMAAVIDNWQCLHGRGAEPSLEGERILQRIYVGEKR